MLRFMFYSPTFFNGIVNEQTDLMKVNDYYSPWKSLTTEPEEFNDASFRA